MVAEKYVIPAGCNVIISIHSVHRDPEFYPDPEKFNPDRFLPENEKSRPSSAYLPFSAGQMACMGKI